MFGVMVTSILRICLLLWGEKIFVLQAFSDCFSEGKKKNILAEFSLCFNLDGLLHFYCFDTPRLFYRNTQPNLKKLQIGAFQDRSI